MDELAQQHWPEATLYVVATPIGNMADLSQRALYALQIADQIACEDTRSSRGLLANYGISKPLIAAHRHNESKVAETILMALRRGQRLALISDAGTPAVSDPGAHIVELVHKTGFRVVPIPGASAVTTLLMASGLTSDKNPAFAFAGFAPHRVKARQAWLAQWVKLPATVVMYETPHRIQAFARDLRQLVAPQRRIAVGRELTKRFEEIAVMTVSDLEMWLLEETNRLKGEFALALEAPAETTDQGLETKVQGLLEALLQQQLSVRDSVAIVCNSFDVSRDMVYEAALALKQNM
ncbi:16S rRNA (cytidine(1402)-2'-O)-methyltransferase [Brackiella oedipodis]|uniref:16S rRNA (cytidine(1402)-2'-O)-methyltransferase n=1 Tax=Brackiella oedipodis TaxID=124225 RepID=UPI001FDFB0E7|nr:16S rRNA (cytidine(1402)-2'-O)-methyltransferase [Brackiella oedipodis]